MDSPKCRFALGTNRSEPRSPAIGELRTRDRPVSELGSFSPHDHVRLIDFRRPPLLGPGVDSFRN
jgi:hypothetical protein